MRHKILHNENDTTPRRVRRLMQKPVAVTEFESLPQYWQMKTIDLTCSTIPDIEEQSPHWLAGNIRGAWGHKLKELQESETSFHPLPRESAYDIFFNTQFLFDYRHPLPVPYSFSVTREKQLFRIKLKIFGFATSWWKDATVALLDCLNHIKTPERKIIRFTTIKKQITHDNLSNIMKDYEYNDFISLKFSSPFVMKSNSSYAGNLKGLIFSIATRFEGLAKWHLLEIEQNWHELIEEAKNIHIKIENLNMNSWERYSQRQGDIPIPMAGMTGTITLSGSIPNYMHTLIKMGELTQIGTYTNFGFGSYKVT